MRDDDALRLGRRAGREDDFGDRVARDLDRRERRRLALGPVELVEFPERRARRLPRDGDILSDQDELGRDDAADALQKVLRRAVVDRDDDDAAQQTAPERGDPFRTVFAPEHHGVALAQAEAVEHRGEVPRAPADFFVRVRPAPEAIVVHEKFAASAEKSWKKSMSVSRATTEL